MIWVGRLAIEEVKGHVFGLCLVNDWSARDIQLLGVSAAGSFSGQELWNHGFSVGGYDGGIGAIPRPGIPAS